MPSDERENASLAAQHIYSQVQSQFQDIRPILKYSDVSSRQKTNGTYDNGLRCGKMLETYS
jgi:hypothetical protein